MVHVFNRVATDDTLGTGKVITTPNSGRVEITLITGDTFVLEADGETIRVTKLGKLQGMSISPQFGNVVILK